MLIRTACEADLPALQRLLRRSWVTTWAPELAFEPVQRFAATDPAGTYAREKWHEFMVAEDGGALLGMYHAEADHLHALHLDPACKRRGIGSHLMDDAERRISRNHAEAHLEVLAFNTGAIAFYEQRGWLRGAHRLIEECGEPVPGFAMTKRLHPPR